jgi:predicted ribosome quality control (RQC) complex YloA/Tae2 family protein
MLSWTELNRAARILEARLTGARLERVVQQEDLRLVLVFRLPSGNTPVLLSCRPEFARLCLLPEAPSASSSPFSFAQFMRAHLLRSAFLRSSTSPHNRQLTIYLSTPGGNFQLILSLLGARSNIYLLDASEKLVHSLRPLEETRGELELGKPWKDPEGALRNKGIDRWADTGDESYLETIAETYRQQELRREAEVLFRRIDTVLTREAGFLDRKLVNLRQDLTGARQAEDLRRKGELLKGVLHAIRKGDESVEAIDYETGSRVEIPLRSELSPSENLETYFARYQKESRGISAIEGQIEEVQSARSEIQTLRGRLEELEKPDSLSLEELCLLAVQPRIRKLLSRYFPSRSARPAQAKGKKEVPGRLFPKRYRASGGLEVWVGRNDEGNDYLTTRLARGNDLFFHLEGYPGSHVVLRTEGRAEAPPEAILDACELAVHFSRLKGSTSADVHVAQIKNVKKPKGAKPGLVYVLRGKTIHLRRNPGRLRDLLASRLDE